jgi:hypothetical protein
MSCCPLSLGHCIYCPSSIYDFWLPFWYQTLLRHYKKSHYVDLWSRLGWLSMLYMVLSQWGARVAQWVRLLDLTAHTSLSPIRRGFAPRFVNYKKGCTRLSTASDKVYQLLVQGRWFSPGTPASSTTKTGRHDIAEILLKVALNTKIQIISQWLTWWNLASGGQCCSIFNFLYIAI